MKNKVKKKNKIARLKDETIEERKKYKQEKTTTTRKIKI